MKKKLVLPIPVSILVFRRFLIIVTMMRMMFGKKRLVFVFKFTVSLLVTVQNHINITKRQKDRLL